MEKRGFGGQPADRSALELIEVGALSLAVEYRFVGEEQGPSIHVFGPVGGADEEILRFDCFDRVPHYHYGFSYIDQAMVPIDTAAVGDAFEWVCDTVEQRLPDLLAKADAPDAAAAVDMSGLATAMSTIRDRGRALAAEHA